MKINEVISEGFWSGLAKGVGAVAKGATSGVAQGLAPNTMKSGKPAKQAGLNLMPIISDDEVELRNITSKLLAKAQATKKITTGEIVSALTTNQPMSESLYTANNKEELKAAVGYISSVLAQAGITVVDDTPDTTPTPKKTAEGEPITWDPNKSMLTVGNKTYQMKGNGWKDWYNKAMVTDPAQLEKIKTAFEIVTDQIPEPKPAAPIKYKPIQVKTPGGEVLTKNEEDGNWYYEDGAYDSNPDNIAELERRAKPQYANRTMQGLKNPPEAQALQPAVFTSNRPAV